MSVHPLILQIDKGHQLLEHLLQGHSILSKVEELDDAGAFKKAPPDLPAGHNVRACASAYGIGKCRTCHLAAAELR